MWVTLIPGYKGSGPFSEDMTLAAGNYEWPFELVIGSWIVINLRTVTCKIGFVLFWTISELSEMYYVHTHYVQALWNCSMNSTALWYATRPWLDKLNSLTTLRSVSFWHCKLHIIRLFLTHCCVKKILTMCDLQCQNETDRRASETQFSPAYSDIALIIVWDAPTRKVVI